MLSERQIGYIAGMVDGEGSVYYDKIGARVCVYSSDLNCIEKIHEITKMGYISTYKTASNGKMTKWTVAKKNDVLILLSAILPALMIKKMKARKMIQDLSSRI